MHLSDVSWGDEEDAVRRLEKNQEIEAIVLSIDVERERISLGMKQLEEDSFNEFTTSNKKNSRVTGKVSEITENRIILDLLNDVQVQKQSYNQVYLQE